MTDFNPQDCSLQFLTIDPALEKYHCARFEKGTRYYAISLEKDLFQDWIITLVNGRIQTPLGKMRILAFDSYLHALSQFCIATKIRVKRGYQLESFKSYN